MKDMTEKENAIYEFEKMAKWCDKYTTEELQAINYARKILHSVTHKEPKTGHWITENMSDGDVGYRCSECNELFWLECGTPKDNKYNFCPKCGERLIEPQESEE